MSRINEGLRVVLIRENLGKSPLCRFFAQKLVLFILFLSVKLKRELHLRNSIPIVLAVQTRQIHYT